MNPRCGEFSGAIKIPTLPSRTGQSAGGLAFRGDCRQRRSMGNAATIRGPREFGWRCPAPAPRLLVRDATPTKIRRIAIWKLRPTNQGFLEARESRIWAPEID